MVVKSMRWVDISRGTGSTGSPVQIIRLHVFFASKSHGQRRLNCPWGGVHNDVGRHIFKRKSVRKIESNAR